jgi:flagellar hook-length control protein FliK
MPEVSAKPDFIAEAKPQMMQPGQAQPLDLTAALRPETPAAASVEAPATVAAAPAESAAPAPVAAPVTASAPNSTSAQPTQAAGAPLPMTDAEWPEMLVEQFDLMDLGDGQEIEITLTPERLGKLRIQMELRDGAATVQIVTENPDAAKLFNDNQARLMELMQKAGFDLAGHQAGTNGREASDGSAQQGEPGHDPRAQAQAQDEDAPKAQTRASDSRIDVVA